MARLSTKSATPTSGTRKHPPQPPPPTPPTAAPTTATARLQAARHVLSSLAARHRNQLGRAGGGGCGGIGWWRTLGQLRRGVRRLLEARTPLPPSSSRGEGETAGRGGKKKQGSRPTRRDEEGDDGRSHEIEVRARWLRDVLVPRCYVLVFLLSLSGATSRRRFKHSDAHTRRAFSQVVADNQHAALGIVLLGVLADVATAAASLLPTPALAPPPADPDAAADDQGVGEEEEVSRQDAADQMAAPGKQQVGAGDGDWEMGVPVSRAELEQQREGKDTQRRTATERRDRAGAKSLSEAGRRKRKR